MTWGFVARRRAEEFNALVEGTSTRQLHDAYDEELLALVGAMRSVPQVAPRPDFVTDLRERLMAEAATALEPVDLDRLRLPQRRPARERRLAALAAGVAIVGATTSVAVASQSAIPGDSLYPVKRVIERAHAELSVGEGDRGAVMLGNASDRLSEVEALTKQHRLGDDLRIADTLSSFTDEATQGSDLLLADYAHTGDQSSVVKLRDFAASSMDRLAVLEPAVPDDARDELVRAAGVLQTIASEATQRCPSCGGTPLEVIPPALAGGETITIPQLPSPLTQQTSHHPQPPGRHHTRQHTHQGHQSQDPQVPAVGGALPPGSVTDPSTGPGLPLPSLGGTRSDGPSDPIRSLTEGLTHGGSSDGPLSGVGDTVGGVVGGVTGLVGGVTSSLTSGLGASAHPDQK